MPGPSSALEAANEELLELASQRLRQLRQMGQLEGDALQQAFQDTLANWKLRDVSERVRGAVEGLTQEMTLREGLQRALSLPGLPEHARAVPELVERLDALQSQLRGSPYLGDAKVAAPCIPCLQKAIDRELKQLAKLPDMAKEKAQTALKRITRQIVRVDPAVFRVINEQLGTLVDFPALARFDGGQWLEGLVAPLARGVTIGTGFDLGAWKPGELLTKLRLPEAIAAKLEPYVGVVRREAAALLRRLPLEVTRAEANLIDRALRSHVVKETMRYWDAHRPRGAPSYRELTSARQSVLFSRALHQALGAPATRAAQDFYRAAQQSDWAAAERHLRECGEKSAVYLDRVRGEADLLRRELQPGSPT